MYFCIPLTRTPCTSSHYRSYWSLPSFSSATFQNYHGIYYSFSEVSKFQRHSKLRSKFSTLMVSHRHKPSESRRTSISKRDTIVHVMEEINISLSARVAKGFISNSSIRSLLIVWRDIEVCAVLTVWCVFIWRKKWQVMPDVHRAINLAPEQFCN